MTNNSHIHNASRVSLRYLLILFLLVVVLIVSIGWYYYGRQRDLAYVGAKEELRAISKLKSDQIQWWINERRRDAIVLLNNVPAIAAVQTYFFREPRLEKEMIVRWLESVRSQYEYEAIGLFDKHFVLRLSAGNLKGIVNTKAMDTFNQVMRHPEIVLTDLHRDPFYSRLHMGIYVPLSLFGVKQQGAPIGVLLLLFAPDRFIFPLIQEWPTPSPTAETLLVRKEGGHVVFLNQLRHIQNKPLEMKLSTGNKDLPATMAVEGKKGIVTGTDYRGIPVIADIRPVPATRWFIVCKKDISEIEAPLRRQALLALIAVLSVIVATALVLYFFLNRENTYFYQRMYAVERGRREALDALHEKDQRIRTYFDESIIGMAIVSPQREWIEVNQRLCDMLGYRMETLKNIPWHNLVHPDDRRTDSERFNQMLSGNIDSYTIELRLFTNAENVIYTTMSIRAIQRKKNAVDYCVVQLVDITAQREALLERIQVDKLSSLGLLVAGIAHELNNPLMGIINYAQTCLDSGSTAEPIKLSCRIPQRTRAG